jgi:hypothetical protein
MPRPVRISLWLFIAAVLASPVIGVIDPRPRQPFPAGSGLVMLIVVAFFLCLFLYVAYNAYRGQSWARWVLALLGVAALATDIPSLARDLAVVPLIGGLEIAVACCQSASLVLLFVPGANHWYRSVAGADGT